MLVQTQTQAHTSRNRAIAAITFRLISCLIFSALKPLTMAACTQTHRGAIGTYVCVCMCMCVRTHVQHAAITDAHKQRHNVSRNAGTYGTQVVSAHEHILTVCMPLAKIASVNGHSAIYLCTAT